MSTDGRAKGMPSYAAVLRVPGYLPIFIVGALSMWGDFIARFTIAAVVYERTRSPLATATTLAVSLLPSVFGRSLFGPIVDRFPYRVVLVAAHLGRAVCVAVLIVLVVSVAPLWGIFAVLFVLEAIGGAAIAANLVLLTDFFLDRRLYARAIGLAALSEQLNQAIGLVVGGTLVVALGARYGLLADLLTFVAAAVVIAWVAPLRAVTGEHGKGLRGFFSDIRVAAGDLARHPVLFRLVLLSTVAGLAIAAPEALAIPLAGSSGWGGYLMAAPIAGAVVGILLISRRSVESQNAAVLPVALLMPLPLLLTALDLPLWTIAALWCLSGALQAFMVPLQSTFTLVTAPELRGRIFSLAGALSVSFVGLSYLAAGWIGQYVGPARGVAICAGICLVLIALTGVRWPSAALRTAVDTAYRPGSEAA
ncbi:MAG: MFS transporter [Dermatophilaceae bacterium]